MNKKQLFIIWCALLVAVSMIWFPGEWFGYIVNGYPVIKPESPEFIVKVLLPLAAFTILLVYSLRNGRKGAAGMEVQAYRHRSSLMSRLLLISGGLVAGFVGGYYMLSPGNKLSLSTIKQEMKVDETDDQFRNFCRREGYRQEVEALTRWLKDEQADSVAIIYNGDDAYSHDLYTYFMQSLANEKITVAFSNMFQEGNKSFFQQMKALEAAQPEAIIFLGTYEERVAFLESVSQQTKEEFWRKRRHKIKWIE